MTYLRTFSALLINPIFIVHKHTTFQYYTLETLIQQYMRDFFLLSLAKYYDNIKHNFYYSVDMFFFKCLDHTLLYNALY